MIEEELYNEYRKNNCKSFTDFLINKIAELKKEVLEVRQHLDLTEREWGKDLDKQIHFKTLCTKLEEENAELKCECRRCVYTDCPCILSDYGKDKNGICDHFKDVFEELEKWKAEWQEQVQKATDEGYARTLQTIQLSKAKELLEDLIRFQPYINKEAIFLLVGNEWKTAIYKAEQFLRGVEK